MGPRPRLRVDDAVVAEFAARHGVRRLALYGSVLRDFSPTSDVDILVEFQPDRTPGLIRLAEMELEMEAPLGRAAELRTYEGLSPYFRDQIAATARPLYAAQGPGRHPAPPGPAIQHDHGTAPAPCLHDCRSPGTAETSTSTTQRTASWRTGFVKSLVAAHAEPIAYIDAVDLVSRFLNPILAGPSVGTWGPVGTHWAR